MSEQTFDRRTRMAKLLADFEQAITPAWAGVREAYADDPDKMLMELAGAVATLDAMRNFPGMGLASILGIVGAMHTLQRMAEWEAQLSCEHDWVQINGEPSMVKCSKCCAER
jgi:hypothetical protein